MFHSLVVLLLVNFVSRSLGAPTSKNNGTVLANSISIIADNCGNSFISSQIKSRISDCNVIVPPYKEKEFLCLMFYDINSRLCYSLGTSKFKDEDYTMKINEMQNVNEVCTKSKNWYFTNIIEYPDYKNTIEKVFKNPFLCVKICGSDEIVSEDTNYFCKYFKWGTEILNQQVKIKEIDANKSAVLPILVDTPMSNDTKTETPLLSSNSNEAATQTHNSSERDAKPALAEEKTMLAKVEEPTKIAKVNPIVTQTTTNKQSQISVNSDNAEKSDNLHNDIKIEKGDEKPQIVLNAVPSSDDVVNKASSEDTKPINNDEISKENQLLPNQIGEQKESVLENPQGQVDPEDYQGDSEEGKDSIVDQGDDSDDPMLDNFDIKPDSEQNKNSKKTESFMSSFNGEIPQREYYPNTIPDGYTTDDDHFFSFFLTAVILVVLLYILYHNKNKVSKVFFGLIVEGRQPGRRRNSRGHAYRRLDTLEQAMSTNTAAPPSKIIY